MTAIEFFGNLLTNVIIKRSQSQFMPQKEITLNRAFLGLESCDFEPYTYIFKIASATFYLYSLSAFKIATKVWSENCCLIDYCMHKRVSIFLIICCQKWFLRPS